MAVDSFLDSSLMFPFLGLSSLSCFPLGSTVGKCKGMAKGLEEDKEDTILLRLRDLHHMSDK